MHGVSLGIGNADPLDRAYLAKLRLLKERIEPSWVSDHLCWGAFGGHHSHDLLPLPYTEEVLRYLVDRILAVQEALGCRMTFENVSSYVSFRESEMSEWEFLGLLCKQADCHLLLDVNNIYVSAYNHGFSVQAYLEGIPVDRVRQYHLAGHTDQGDYLHDTHIGPVIEGVWDVYRRALERFGAQPTLIEWDQDIPSYEEVVAEVERARAIEKEWLAAQTPSNPRGVETQESPEREAARSDGARR
jgi:uncharacterized protein (UPF0276 family)